VRYIPDLLSLSEARELAMRSGHSASEAETDISRALREGKIRFRRAFEQVTFRGRTVDPELFRRMTFEDRNRFRLRVPADLAPEDLDWENSRPGRPWPLGEGYFAHIARLELSRRDLEKVFSLVKTKASAREEASQAEAERKRAEAKRKRKRAEAKRKLKRAEERAAGKAREEASQAAAETKRAEAKRKRRLAEAKRQRKRALERSVPEAREEASPPSDTGRRHPRRKWARLAVDGAYPNDVPGQAEVPNNEFVDAVTTFAKSKGWNVGGRDTILRAAGRRRR
jgi:hypothetical protein